MKPGTKFRIANTKETEWLLQPELRAIDQKLEYKELQSANFTSRGYVNEEGQHEGVAVTEMNDGEKHFGEYHLGKLHGIAYCVFPCGSTFWGQY